MNILMDQIKKKKQLTGRRGYPDIFSNTVVDDPIPCLG